MLPLIDQPVKIEQGRDVLQRTRYAIEVFKDQLLPQLPVGEETYKIYKQMLEETLTTPDAIRVDQQSQARYQSLVILPGGGERSHGTTGRPVAEVGAAMLDTTRDWLTDAVRQAQVQLEPAQIEDLTYGWLIWHELGHTLQAAYERTDIDPATRRSSHFDLAYEALTRGVSQQTFSRESGGGQEFANLVAEGEAFAEGLGQMMVERYAVKELGLAEEQAAALRVALTPQVRKDRRQQVYEIVRRYDKAYDMSHPDSPVVDMSRDLRAAGFTGT